MSWEEYEYLHIYAQHSHHQESFIVGNKKALIKLRQLIDKALKDDIAIGNFFPSDEEGFDLHVALVDNQNTFNSLEMPYTEQFGEVNNHTYFINENDDQNAPYSPIILFQKK